MPDAGAFKPLKKLAAIGSSKRLSRGRIEESSLVLTLDSDGEQTMKKAEIVEIYERTGSIRATAKIVGAGYQAVRRILWEAGAYTSAQFDEVNQLYDSGYDVAQICETLNMSRSSVMSYLPYTRGTRIAGERTINSIRIMKCRAKKKSAPP